MRRDSGLLLAAFVAAAAVSLVASASAAYRVVGDVRLWGSPAAAPTAHPPTPTTGASPGPAPPMAEGAPLALDAGLLARVAAVAAVVIVVVAALVVVVGWVRRQRVVTPAQEGSPAPRVPTPPAGVVVWTLLGVAIVLTATTGSQWATIGAVATAVIALAWLHVVLTALIDPVPPRAPYAPSTMAGDSAVRLGSLWAELDRAIGRPQYDGSVRPRLAELARDRLGRHGIDPDTPTGRLEAVARVGVANCDYLFPADGPGTPLDPARLDALLTALEEL